MDLSRKERDNILRWDGLAKGFFEVYYLKWNDEPSRTAGWVRYTLTSPKKNVGKPYCELWGIFFDAENPKNNYAVKRRFPIYDLAWETRKFMVRIAGAELNMDRCFADVTDPKTGHSLAWDFRIRSGSDTYRYFPSEFFYSGPFPKTKVLSPHMDARFNGRVVVDGRQIDVCDAPGQQIHLWGARYAQRWARGHCNTFSEDPCAVWEGLDTQIRMGPVKSPHLKLFYLKFDGRSHFFNSPAYWFKNKSRWELGRWEFEFADREVRVMGVVNCEYDEIVAVTYTDPDGKKLWCNNSKVASISMKIFNPSGTLIGTLSSDHGSAAEFVDRIIFPQVLVRI